MAKGKGRRADQNPEPITRSPVAAHRLATPSAWHDMVATALGLMGLAATLFIWLYEPLPQATQLKLTTIVWALAAVGVAGRVHARKAVFSLRAARLHDEVMHARLAPDITERQSGLRMRHVSAWSVAALGLAATSVLWQTQAIERHVGGLTPLAVGTAVSAMFALVIAANSINRMKSKRLARDFRTALNSERLALGTLGGVDALVCAGLPTGERTRFNERYVQLLGRSAEQLQGLGWLDSVQADDRKPALDMLAEPPTARRHARQHDLCVRRASGELAWLRETLTPRFDETGKLIEYICTAIDITTHVETEAALDKQVGALTAELAEVKVELSKSRTARNRFEKNMEEARDEVKNLSDALTKAETAVAKVQAESAARIKEAEGDARQRVRDAEEAAEARVRKLERATESRVERLEESLKSAHEELKEATAENKKLARSFEKLQDELMELRQQESEARAQLVRHIKETRETRDELSDSHTREAQHRAKSDRLVQRCEELEKQLAGKDAEITSAESQAQQASVAAMAEVERRLHEVSAEALAGQLRKHIDSMQRMTSELLGAALAGPVQDAAHNTAASLRTMSDLVDQALGRVEAHKAEADVQPQIARSAAATSFDLRRTARGVRDMLAESARARGVKLEVEIAPKLPVLVHGDDLEVRTAMLSLTDAALVLAEDGTLMIRLSEDVSTGAYSTIRCELCHASARVRSDIVESSLAMKATDDDMPDASSMPLAHQAAKAWKALRALQGQRGYMLPDGGGFMVWFTFTLDRPAAAAAVAVPCTAPSVASRDEGAATPMASAAPKPAAAQSKSRSLRAALAAVTEIQRDDAAPRAEAETPETIVDTDPSAAKHEAGQPDEVMIPAYVGGPPQAQADLHAPPRQPQGMPRMPQEMLVCNLGEVVELGGDSMRVLSPKALRHGGMMVSFHGVETDMQLRAEVLWCKKIVGRKHDVGLKFVGVTAADHKRIMQIAMQHRCVPTMLDEGEAR